MADERRMTACLAVNVVILASSHFVTLHLNSQKVHPISGTDGNVTKRYADGYYQRKDKHI